MENDFDVQTKELVKHFITGKSDKEIAKYNFRNESKKLSNVDGIIGFKEYKQAYRMGSKFDCDRSDLVMAIWCVLLEADVNVRSVNGYTKRAIEYIDLKGKIITVETDTINSLEIDLNKYIRSFIQKKYKTKWHVLYSKGAGLKNGEIIGNAFPEQYRSISEFNRDKWLLDNFSQIFDEEKPELLKAYERLANLTHSVGNFMIGPVGFNYSDIRAKSKSNDRVDIFFRKVKEVDAYSDWKNWFSAYMNVNVMDMYFIGDSHGAREKSELIDLREGTELEWINRVNDLIEIRGIKIARQVKSIFNIQG